MSDDAAHVGDMNADGGSQGESLEGVCRDYMRNVCRRGASCKFRHPEQFEAEELGKQIEYVFCHDYQVSAARAAPDDADRLTEQGVPARELPLRACDESGGGAVPRDREAATARAE